jgi:methyl-accepting chemotaxis protein
VAKTSYIQLFEPWGWVIGSGVYIDDVQAEFARQLREASLVGLGIALLMALLVMLIARSIARPLQEAVQAMGNIASGESDLTRRLDTHGRDESPIWASTSTVSTASCRAWSASCRAPPTPGRVGRARRRQRRRRPGAQQLQMDQVATAINEVTYAVQDVAKHAEQAASEMRDAQQQVGHGQQASTAACSRSTGSRRPSSRRWR